MKKFKQQLEEVFGKSKKFTDWRKMDGWLMSPSENVMVGNRNIDYEIPPTKTAHGVLPTNTKATGQKLWATQSGSKFEKWNYFKTTRALIDFVSKLEPIPLTSSHLKSIADGQAGNSVFDSEREFMAVIKRAK